MDFVFWVFWEFLGLGVWVSGFWGDPGFFGGLALSGFFSFQGFWGLLGSGV